MRGGFGVGAGGERELCARSRRGDCRDTPCLRGARGREGGRARKSRRHYGVYGVTGFGARVKLSQVMRKGEREGCVA